MNKILPALIITAGIAAIALDSFSNKSGPGGGYTNAPSESSCAQGGCHGGTVQSGGTKFRLKSNFTGNGYIPDSTYTITLSIVETNINTYGFQVTALSTKDNLAAGTLSTVGSRVQKMTASIGGKTREYIGHVASSTSSVGTDSNAWVFSWKAPSTNVGTVRFYAIVNAADGNSTSSGDKIIGKTFDLGLSSLMPVAKAGGDTVGCTGQQVQLSGSGTNSPTSYSWSIPGATPSTSTAQNPKVSWSTIGTKLAILTVKNSKGTSKPDTFRVKIGQTPTASIQGASSYSLCSGDSVTLTATGAAGVSYLWLPVNKTGQKLTVKDSGTYRVQVTNTTSKCVAVSAPVTVTVKPRPTVGTVVLEDTVCKGSTIQINSIPTAGYDSFQLYTGNTWLASASSGFFNRTATGNTSFNIRAWNKGCVGFSQNNKSVWVFNPLPNAAPQVVQSGITYLDLKWRTVGGALGYQVSKDSGKTWQSTAGDTAFRVSGLNPGNAIRLHVRVLDIAPCNNNDTSIVGTTLPCSSFSFGVTWDTLVCNNDTIHIEITGVNGKRFSASVGGPFVQQTRFWLIASQTGNVNLQVVDSNSLSCPPILKPLFVRVEKLPALLMTIAPNVDSICINDRVTLQGTAGYKNYQFYRNATVVQNSASKSYSLNITGTGLYGLMAYGDVCQADAGLQQIKPHPRPTLDISFSRNGSVYTLNTNDTIAKNYIWNFGDGSSPQSGSARQLTHDYSSSANKTVTVRVTAIGVNGCDQTDTLDITVPDFTSVQRVSMPDSYSVYPIPAGKELNIRTENAAEFSAVLYSADGKETGRWKSGTGDMKIATGEMNSGVYLLKISDAAGDWYRKVIIAP